MKPLNRFTVLCFESSFYTPFSSFVLPFSYWLHLSSSLPTISYHPYSFAKLAYLTTAAATGFSSNQLFIVAIPGFAGFGTYFTPCGAGCSSGSS